MNKYYIGIVICMMVGAFSVGCMLTASTYTEQYYSVSTMTKISPAESVTSVEIKYAYDPLANIPTWGDYQEMIIASRDNVSAWFNERYNTTLAKPNLSFEAPAYNETKCYYDMSGDKAIHIANKTMWEHDEEEQSWFYLSNKTVELAIWHEVCHYAMDNYCGADYVKERQESFCEVFAGVNNTNCVGEYCEPYKTADVDRMAFLDCFFANGCGIDGYHYTHMEACYDKWKIK